MSIRGSFLEQRKRVALAALVIGFLVAALTVSMADDALFSDNFELGAYTEVAHGFIELRASDGTVRERRSTDGSGRFEQFSETMVQPGDKLVVYGGFWRSQPFAGEMTLLLAESDSFQILTPITTLVTRLAESGQVNGSTPAQRIDQAVDKLAALYMVGDDWHLPNPEWVSGDLAADIDANGGLLNWNGRLLQQIQAEFLDESHMQAFPYANAAIREVGSGDLERRWLPGDSGQIQLSADLTIESPPGLTFQVVDGEGPAAFYPIEDGVLKYEVPHSIEPRSGELVIEATHLGLGRSRNVTFAFEVVDGAVVAEEYFDSTGGEIWHPNGAYGYRILTGAVSGSPVEVRLIDYTDEEGNLRTSLRTYPPHYEFDPPLEFLSAPGFASAESRGAIDDCDIEWDDGWEEVACQKAPFVSLINPDAILGFSRNRVPDSALDGLSAPADWLIDTIYSAPAWALGKHCTDCSARNTPVLFVHGYKPLGLMGGGSSTWGDLPELLHDFPGDEFAVYEFRYRSNARFEDVASDLGDAIELIHAETQAPVQIIAHSFGGLVSRRYLQGLTDHSVALAPFTSCAESRHPRVSGLLTLGSPHSGISATEGIQQGIRMPKGRDGIPGAGIETCQQLSCWQAGADEQAAFMSVLDGIYDVDNEAGTIVAALSDFQTNPLPVPTMVAVGLRWKDWAYGGGDNLISYQGQRFAPALSCNASSCFDQSMPQNHRESVDGVPIGHCVTETVLGAEENQPYPLPGQAVQPRGSYFRNYFHAFPGNPVEAKVSRQEHMPYLTEYGTSWWVSTHDSFNRILNWLLNSDNQLMVNIQGQGSVEVIAGGETYDCQSSCVLPMTATEANIDAQPASGASFEGFSPNCTGSGQSCNVSVGRATTVNVAFSGGDQALLVVNRSGPGQVTVEPGGQVCSLPQCQYTFAPGTEVTLGAEAGSGALFSGWSGSCADAGAACTLTLQSGGTATVAPHFIQQPGDTFKDCPYCPNLVEIPAGSFVQGSPPHEPQSNSSERPQHVVNVQALAIGQTEVTFDEWDACVDDGGCAHDPVDAGWGRGDRPVIYVNWHDAQEYVNWLSNQTGHDYRLPSESEWEYVTRAGTTGRFNTGDCITTDQANFDGTAPAQGCPNGVDRAQTLPVGSFAPNAFGLYDTHGNVWEWVQDCWNPNYEGAPTDGSAWMSGDCSSAVLRDGSWYFGGQGLRSADRSLYNRGARLHTGGFRVARSITP